MADTVQDVFKMSDNTSYWTALLTQTSIDIDSLSQIHKSYKDDEMVKSIFNSWKNKAGVGMKISSWMITDEMKLMEHYRMYVAVFGVDVPTTQSHPIESTQGTHMTTSAPGSPKPDVDKGESSAPRKSTKNRDEHEAKQNVEKVVEHLIAEEIEKLVEGTKNVENNEGVNYVLNNQEVPGTRLEPRSHKESLEVEKTTEVQPVNTIEEDEESAEDYYELKRREECRGV
nr:hypothetical protein [Tanacetum cinerariifolium]